MGILAQKYHARLHVPSRLDQWPSKEIGVHRPTRRGVERGGPVAKGLGFTWRVRSVSKKFVFAQARRRKARSKMRCCMDCYTGFGWFPCSDAREHSGFDVCKGGWLPEVTTKKERHNDKKRLDSPRDGKARRRKGGHHTLAKDPWPWHLLH